MTTRIMGPALGTLAYERLGEGEFRLERRSDLPEREKPRDIEGDPDRNGRSLPRVALHGKEKVCPIQPLQPLM